MAKRKSIPLSTREQVLIECGYRCAVPTCRGILALDLHHICEVEVGGSNDPSNLIALCPTDHALYHRGTISADAIYAYKSMIVAISRAFDVDSVDRLLFLESCERDFLIVSGDGLLHFSRLLAAGLAVAEQKSNNNWQIVTYAVNISERGRHITKAWKAGDRTKLQQLVGGPSPELNSTLRQQ